MATSLSYVRSAEEDLICPVCLMLFTDLHIPKSLDCPHVCCQTCLVALLAGSRDKQTISCPECRRRTKVPDRDVANLKTNLKLRSLAEKHAKHLQKKKQNEMDHGVSFCKDHEGEKLHFYCLTCQVSVCQACLVLMHERPKHEIKSVKEVHLEKVKILEATVKRNEKLISDFRRNIQHVTCCEQKINATVKESEQEIDRVAAKAISDIKTKAQWLKQQVHSSNEDMFKKCEVQKRHFQNKASKLQNGVDCAKKILKIKTSHRYLEWHKKVTKQFINLEADENKKMPVSKDDKDGIMSNELTLASYGYNEDLLVNLGTIQRKVVRKLQLQDTYSFPHPITSIACGFGHVVVHMQNKKLIEVYKHNAGKLITCQCRLVPTCKDWHPFDVVVSKAGKILVARSNILETFSFCGKHEQSISLEDSSERRICSMTANEDGHILLGDTYNKEVVIYSKEGRQVNSVGSELWKLAAIGNKYVAASNLENTVCTHPLSGSSGYPFLNSAIGSKISIPSPTALYHDKKTECLLIGCHDINNDGAVIEQYCWETGAKIATLAQELKNPQGMALTDDDEYLIVADENALKFYKMSAETTDFDGKLIAKCFRRKHRTWQIGLY